MNRSTAVYGQVGKLWANGGDVGLLGSGARVSTGLQAALGVKVRW